MLRDKYRFKLTQVDMIDLDDALMGTFIRHGNPKEAEVKLLISILTKVKGRLHAKMLFLKKDLNFSLDTSEAIAFHLAYKNHLIGFKPITARIATEIHQTL